MNTYGGGRRRVPVLQDLRQSAWATAPTTRAREDPGRQKATGGIEGEFKDGEFWVTKCSGIAVDDSTNGVFDIVQNETAADLPAELMRSQKGRGRGCSSPRWLMYKMTR